MKIISKILCLLLLVLSYSFKNIKIQAKDICDERVQLNLKKEFFKDTSVKFKNFVLNDVKHQKFILHRQKIAYIGLIIFNNANLSTPNYYQINKLSNDYKEGLRVITISNTINKKTNADRVSTFNKKINNLIGSCELIREKNKINKTDFFVLIDSGYMILESFKNIDSLKKRLDNYYFLYDIDGFKNKR